MEIHYFHIDHNAPCLPAKFCTNIHFNIQYFSWDDCNIQEKLKTKCKIFGVNIKVHFLDMSGKDGKIILKNDVEGESSVIKHHLNFVLITSL